MRRGWLTFLVLVIIIEGAAAVGTAQSLGQIARETKQQQAKDTKKPIKLYTNDNLPLPAPWEDTSPSMSTTQASAKSEAAETAAAAEATTNEVAERKTKEYWQQKFTAVRRELADAQSAQRLAQDEMSLLQIQQAREIDASVQSQVKAKIEAKQTELADIQVQIDKVQKSLDDLQNEFDASSAPPEWSQTENPPLENQPPSP